MSAHTRQVAFPAAGDGPLLEGVFYLPEGSGPFPAAIVCHPHPLMGGTMDNTIVVTVCRALAAQGWAALRFKYSVHSSSPHFLAYRSDLWVWFLIAPSNPVRLL